MTLDNNIIDNSQNWDTSNVYSFLLDHFKSGEAIVDSNMYTWGKLVDVLERDSSKIIALRGAGSWNGMDKFEIDNILENILIPRIESELLKSGNIIIMHDGDYDNPTKPDIGYVAARLLDHFKNIKNRVIFLTAQVESWHPLELKGRNLVNVNGLQYITYIFPDNTYEGDHNSFTQSETLVNSTKYEQWYIGASGQIANSQLLDYNSKLGENIRGKAVLFRVKINSKLSHELDKQLIEAKEFGDQIRINKVQSKIDQRLNIFGVHWSNDGSPNIVNGLNIDFEFII